MTSERQPKHAPAPSRRPAVAPATAPRRSAPTRTGPNPAELQLRLGNQGTQALLSQLTSAYAAPASVAPKAAAKSERASNGDTAPSFEPSARMPGERPAPATTEVPPVDQPPALSLSGADPHAPETASAAGVAIPQSEASQDLRVATERTTGGPPEPVARREGVVARLQTGTTETAAVLDTRNAATLINSLAAVSPGSLGQALVAAKAVLPRIQVSQNSDLEASLPTLPCPSGLPRRALAPLVASTHLPVAVAPEMRSSGARERPPMETQATEAVGPLPGSNLSFEGAAPAGQDEDSGSWWEWLTRSVSNYLGELPTYDPGLNTSAGPRPAVDLTGEADRGRSELHQRDSGLVVRAQAVQADLATDSDFGTSEIYPTGPAQQLRSNYVPVAPTLRSRPSRRSPSALPDDALAAFDEHVAPLMNGKISDQVAQYNLSQAEYLEQGAKTRAEGERRIAEEAYGARTEQEALRQQVRVEVDAGRALWRQENRRIQGTYASQSEAKRSELDAQIDTRVEQAERQADDKLTGAEKSAATERATAERRAAEERRKAEARPKSWWESFKDTLSAAFSIIKKAICGIFDAARAKVGQIIEGAKAIVRGLIEAARSAIVGLIKAFGEVIKGLVSIALAAFPEAAARARAWIDGKVSSAVDAVNRVAERLKIATQQILDWIGKTLDAALGVLQRAMTFVIDALEFLADMFFQALELLAKLVRMIARIKPMLERVAALIKDPTPAINAIKEFLSGLVAQIPAISTASGKAAITFSPLPKNHWEGIWRHLKPRLDYLAANWWAIVKDTAWLMLWPFGKDSSGKRPLFENVKEIYHDIGDALSAIWHLKFSVAIDKGLRIEQLALAVVGSFYGWVFLGLVIAGGILSAEVGAIPGMAAGAAIAGKIGVGLTIATAAVEAAIMAKSGYDLVFGSNTPEEDEQDYENVANSSLTVAIMGAMTLLGAAAARIARYVIGKVAGLVWRRPVLRGSRNAAGDPIMSRGDVIEVRVKLSEQVVGLLRRRTVTWLEVIRRNWPVVDLVEDGLIEQIPRPKRKAPLYRITGGRIISVKSTAQIGSAARDEIIKWIDQLAGFSTVKNVTVVNPSGRTLIVAVQTPLEGPMLTAVENHAASNGVQLQLTTHLPPNHPAVVFPDQIPQIMSEAGVVAADEVRSGGQGDGSD
ncbi:hypothetical protein [Bradyrhizobium diazoefficiens]|uniref:hypothetical protein n=1 Tax=Bradyrhizobium diazoefficiens TaxID=1355477 RepID=UPI00272DBD8E|nr:hypothetical protein [Bradyrhizobium diazoefficiens]WLA69206.1 hypothetical protein QNN01_22710 [Bradyrhizobium diazoefficiens]